MWWECITCGERTWQVDPPESCPGCGEDMRPAPEFMEGADEPDEATSGDSYRDAWVATGLEWGAEHLR